jgi:hypothetical protein
MQPIVFFSAALFALLLFTVYTKQHLEPWSKSPLLGLVIIGTIGVAILKKREPFESDSVEKQSGKIAHINDLIQSKVTLNQDNLDKLEASIDETTDNISTLQANTGVSEEAQKYA